MIIIKLRSFNDECSWVNPASQSVQFYGSLSLALGKEDNVATINERNRLNKEIKIVLPLKLKIFNGKAAKVKFNVSQTFFRGKVR